MLASKPVESGLSGREAIVRRRRAWSSAPSCACCRHAPPPSFLQLPVDRGGATHRAAAPPWSGCCMRMAWRASASWRSPLHAAHHGGIRSTAWAAAQNEAARCCALLERFSLSRQSTAPRRQGVVPWHFRSPPRNRILVGALQAVAAPLPPPELYGIGESAAGAEAVGVTRGMHTRITQHRQRGQSRIRSAETVGTTTRKAVG